MYFFHSSEIDSKSDKTAANAHLAMTDSADRCIKLNIPQPQVTNQERNISRKGIAKCGTCKQCAREKFEGIQRQKGREEVKRKLRG